MKILHFPLARVTLFFILGLLLYHNGFHPNGITIGVGIVVGIGALAIVHKKFIFGSILGFGWLVALLSVALGISTAALHQENLKPSHYLHYTEDQFPYMLQVTLREKIKNTKKNERYLATLSKINQQACEGKVILNVKLQSQIKTLPIGSELIIKGWFYKNKDPFNPNQFDYSKYLENQHIYGQIYTSRSELTVTASKASLWATFSNFRTTIVENLKQSGFQSKTLAVLVALLLGQQQDIDPETLKNYQSAGAVHILSVSGLHVGFILIFIQYLLKPFPNTKRTRIFKLLVILLSLWSYGILAGLAPSVVRSVTMFSFIAIGQQLQRSDNQYHTLLVSMFLILLWKPSFLYDVGFQLSYLALFFILWLQPLLAGIWLPRNKIVKYFWDILTVSFAAQLGTLPLCLYYFHQFPGLFFVTNLLVLPLLGIIMILGLLAVIIAAFGTVPSGVVILLEHLIVWQNDCIAWVASHDSMVLKNISFTTEMLWASYFVFITVVIGLQKPSFQKTILAMSGVIIFQSILIYNKHSNETVEEMIVFHMKKNTLITYRLNNVVTLFGNDSVQNSLHNNVALQSYTTANFIDLIKTNDIQNAYYFKNKKILLLDTYLSNYPKIQPDILIVTNSPKINLARFLSECKPQQIVADGSNYKSYIRLWKATCEKEKIPFHDTNEKGFYRL